jgi:hypothetical protein
MHSYKICTFIKISLIRLSKQITNSAILASPARQSIKYKFESPYIKIWMDEEGIICGKYADDVHVSFDVAKEWVEARLSICGGNSYPLLVDMKGVKSSSKRARVYLASIGALQVKAGALIVGNSVSRFLGNVFLTIDKPSAPTKLFTDEASARQWLKQYL